MLCPVAGQSGVASGGGDELESGIGEEMKIAEEGEEAIMPKTRKHPSAPSESERSMHNVTHIPFRSWCRHCVRARARDYPDRAVKGGSSDSHTIPTLHMDYWFMRDCKGVDLTTVLTAKEDISKCHAAYVVPAKGKMSDVAPQLVDDLNAWGYRGSEICLKSDQENAAEDILHEVQRLRVETYIW